MYSSWSLYTIKYITVSPILNMINFYLVLPNFNLKSLDSLTFSCESLFHVCFNISLKEEILFSILVLSFHA